MKELSREFLKRLDAEEKAFSGKLKADVLGAGFLTAIKEFDFYYYNYVRHSQTEETELQFHMLQLGMPRFVAGILSNVPKFRYPVLTFKSEKSMIVGALEAVSAFGFIEHGKRLAHGVMAGECGIQRFDERQYDFLMPDIVFNMEQHEASVEHHYRRTYREQLDSTIQKAFVSTGIAARVETLLSENVYVFRDSFIGYEAHPDLDDFFFGLAYSAVQNQNGYDSFNYKLEFGGVQLLKYMLATIYFLSLALKHEAFAEALLRKAEHIRLRDVLTITCDKKGFRASLFDALDHYGPAFDGYTSLKEQEADTILTVLSLRRDNLGLLKSTMAPLPFLIEFSDEAWVKSTAGIQLSGVDFLLSSLSHHFPHDYNRHQRTREHSMQKALRRLLGEYIPGLTCMENITIRRDGRALTDIDFVVVEESSGLILLCQLKHQDPYGADVRKRSSRGTRLRDECESWLSTIRQWLSASSAADVRMALRLKAMPTGQTHRFLILTRHFAHFLSGLDLRDDAVYATWTQFFDALNRMRAENRDVSLQSLFSILAAYMSHVMAQGYKSDLLDSYHLENLSYRVRPASACPE